MSAARAARVAQAPGRVNLIGDHTDYNDGFVLPVALALRCSIDYEVTDGDDHRLVSHDADATAIVDAAVFELRAAGIDPPGIDGRITSTVPIGAGLSSSAAVGVAVVRALLDAAGAELPAIEVAQVAQRVEQRASGVPCGIMDQLVAARDEPGRALRIDCRSLDVRAVAIPAAIEFVVVHSGEERALADGTYAERRAACEAACARLGVTHLRDATAEQVADDPVARHVVSENSRVLAAVDALAAADLDALGARMDESHASLRDDFRVSTPGLDSLVDELRAAGAFGARLTGAGFGGCVVAAFEAGTGAGAATATGRPWWPVPT